LKVAWRALSVVGRVFFPAGPSILRPRRDPATTRTVARVLSGDWNNPHLTA
jgi:hypothetical protein